MTPQQNLSIPDSPRKPPPKRKNARISNSISWLRIHDVTSDVQAATAGKTGDAANKALMQNKRSCRKLRIGSKPALRSDFAVPRRVYDLYRYKRYADVRLCSRRSLRPRQFGGDPDNFNFPRFDFDIGLLRRTPTTSP